MQPAGSFCLLLATPMVICRYFIQGRCKYGAQCINEHPGVSPGTTMNGGPAGPRPGTPLTCFSILRHRFAGFHRNQSVVFNGPTAMTPSQQPSLYADPRPPSGLERSGRGGSVRPHSPSASATALNHQQARPQQPSNQIRYDQAFMPSFIKSPL